MTEDGTLELWLVRHGETTHSAGRRIAGWCDPPLATVWWIGELQLKRWRGGCV